MKAITILRTLLKESIETENCGIVCLYEGLQYSDFIQQYFYDDFQSQDNTLISEGQYFYCWHTEALDLPCYIQYINGEYLHFMKLNEE